MSGIPVSLLHNAKQRELTAVQAELMTHCRTLEQNVRQMLARIDSSKIADPAWLTIARSHLQIGMMCVNRSITRHDFF